LVNIYCAG